jgi:glycosyltransferase involved in cell wall biosynthesis
MIKNKTFVITGLQAWDTPIGSNCKNIAEEISKYNKVLYVNYPLDRLTVYRNKNEEYVKKRIKIINGEQSCYEKVNENLTVFYPQIIIESNSKIPTKFLFKLINKYNNKRFAKELRKALIDNNITDFIHFNDSDMYRSFYLKELINPSMSIYYIRDNLIHTKYWGKHGQYVEPQLIRKSNLVVCNSLYYEDYARLYNQKSFMIGQGCDISLFQDNDTMKIPDDIKHISKPIIGYMGYLSGGRLDINLIEFIAKTRPNWNIVLVGPEDDKFKTSNLHSYKNIHFMGSRNMIELPAYIKGFDIAMNPQTLNIFTIGNYPRKIDEYLAMGKPTLATKTKAMEYFADSTYLANNYEEYIILIEKALEEDSLEKQNYRKKVAANHSWENNVAEIYQRILEINPKI